MAPKNTNKALWIKYILYITFAFTKNYTKLTISINLLDLHLNDFSGVEFTENRLKWKKERHNEEIKVL